jgi:hypothetical protein
MKREITVAYLGNHAYPHTTESEYRHAFESRGHEVTPIQEGDPAELARLCDDLHYGRGLPDMVLWTRTPQLAKDNGEALQWRLIAECERAHVPLVGVHLDRWWGLEREHMIFEDPYFRVNVLFTADGGHQEQWDKAGVNHRWLLPAISERWCKSGKPLAEARCDVMFVGSWKHYHNAWQHRQEMIAELSRWYPRTFRVFPVRGMPRITMLDLNDYYWSAKVVVGDSCLVPLPDGSPMVDYCSDRVPETLGRGGWLAHPEVYGINQAHDSFDAPSMVTWRLGDFDHMRRMINEVLETNDATHHRYRLASIDYIKAAHTYSHRVDEMLEVLTDEGWLP